MRREGGAGGFNAYVTSQPSAALRSPLSWPTSSSRGKTLLYYYIKLVRYDQSHLEANWKNQSSQNPRAALLHSVR